ncbi:hypothetical protein [Actinomadura sp. 21ATH]|uniref:hypothetical protein n=1 Tax=Actinomadura sp. 21ATH TaxID=1735444 RepID=UPI0035BFA53B
MANTDPMNGLQPPSHDDDTWDEPRLPPPAETGIHAIDADAAKLYAVAVGTPVKRRGPAPQNRRHRRFAPSRPATPQDPGSQLADLAQFLVEHTKGGALHRRLHPQG